MKKRNKGCTNPCIFLRKIYISEINRGGEREGERKKIVASLF